MAYRRRDELSGYSDVLTEEEVEHLLVLRNKGHSLQWIADYFGVHRNTVRNILARVKENKK